jgi:hypothetical protein
MLLVLPVSYIPSGMLLAGKTKIKSGYSAKLVNFIFKQLLNIYAIAAEAKKSLKLILTLMKAVYIIGIGIGYD